MNTTRDSKEKFLRIGHRGACGHAPENTLKSFRKAMELGVDMVELDVHLCQSSELVVIHDSRLERTTNARGYVARKTLPELKKSDAGEGESIPTLQEVLDLLDKRVKVNIELKGPKTILPVLKIIEKNVKERGWRYDDFVLSAFKRSILKKLSRIKSPCQHIQGQNKTSIKTGVLLVERRSDVISFAKKVQADYIHAHRYLIDECFVRQAQQNGLKVFVWTVNEKQDIERFKSYGVDGIFSDYPDRI